MGGKGPHPHPPAPRAPARPPTNDELARLYERERPVLARYVLRAADLNGDGQLSVAERDWATLELARRQRKRARMSRAERDAADAKEAERARQLKRRTLEWNGKRVVTSDQKGRKKVRSTRVVIPGVERKRARKRGPDPAPRR